jgi:hypothetical protein
MKKSTKNFIILYKNESFQFNIDIDFDLNYLQNLMIKNLNLKILDDQIIILYYIELQNSNDKIIINNNKDLELIIKYHESNCDNNKPFIFELEIKEKSLINNITMSEIDQISLVKEFRKDNENENLLKESQILNYLDEQNHFLIKCFNCNCGIKENMFICIICDNYFLCENCFKLHSNQHPMFVISKKSNYPSINSLSDFNCFLNINNENKLNDEYRLELMISKVERKFSMPFMSKKTIELVIYNKGKFINFPIYILLIDSRNLIIKTNFITKLSKKESTIINIEIESNDNIEQLYSMNIFLYTFKNIFIKYNKIIIDIFVTSEENANKFNISIFKKYKNIHKWNKEIQIKLFNLYFEKLLSKDLKTIDEFIFSDKNDKWEDIEPLITF